MLNVKKDWEEQAVDGKRHHQDDQRHHHPFGHPLQALLNTDGDDEKAGYDDQTHVNRHAAGIGKHIAKGGFRCGDVKSREASGGGVHEYCSIHPETVV